MDTNIENKQIVGIGRPRLEKRTSQKPEGEKEDNPKEEKPKG